MLALLKARAKYEPSSRRAVEWRETHLERLGGSERRKDVVGGEGEVERGQRYKSRKLDRVEAEREGRAGPAEELKRPSALVD